MSSFTKLGISMGMGTSMNMSTKATALSMAVTTRERVVTRFLDLDAV